MVITHLGAKRVQGLKIDRTNDSLGSSADGSNTGITLIEKETLGTPATTLDSTNGTTDWAENGSLYTIDTSNNQIDFALQRNNTGSTAQYGYIDLQDLISANASDTKWTLRFRLNFGTIDNPSNSYNSLKSSENLNLIP